MATNLPLPSFVRAAPIKYPRRKPSRMTAPPGECPYCDARREYGRIQVEKYRPKKQRARQ